MPHALPISFTATPVNGGAAPSYLWKVNGTISGSNNPVFSYLPGNDDIVTCILTSSELCPSVNPVAANPVVMVINPILPVSVSITSSANPVCSGTQVTFTATPVHQGASPVFLLVVN